jgi:hypothetical protein
MPLEGELVFGAIRMKDLDLQLKDAPLKNLHQERLLFGCDLNLHVGIGRDSANPLSRFEANYVIFGQNQMSFLLAAGFDWRDNP